MRKILRFSYKRLSLIQKLLIPMSLSLISGAILTIVIIQHINKINSETTLLEKSLIPILEKLTNNKALLKNISENFTFAILAEEEDLLSELKDKQTIEKNIKTIIEDKKIDLNELENTLDSFKRYFTLAQQYTLNNIHDNAPTNKINTQELLLNYNQVTTLFFQLQEAVKNKITLKIKFIDKTSKQLMYFTIIYILFFSLGLFYLSYIIYRDLNRRFENLNKNLNVLKNQTTLFQNHDVLDILSNNINETVTNYEIINKQRKELVRINKNIQNSIEYASLIQEAIIPSKVTLNKYSKDNFVFLKQKDTVGGDIYLIVELESQHEILIMLIDGVGHGVSGAFLTILVKALEHQLVEQINNNMMPPSPAKILQYFNQNIKKILQQEKNSKSNVGFDGGVLYYNSATNICKYAGAKTPLYIINNKELTIIKSDRKSVGFIRTKMDQEYREYDIEIQKDTKIYFATDGIIDQEGSNEKRYGSENFQMFLQNHHFLSFKQQLELLQYNLLNFQGDIPQSDDITIMGLQFK